MGRRAIAGNARRKRLLNAIGGPIIGATCASPLTLFM